MTVQTAATDDVFGGDKFCVAFSQTVSWMGSSTEWRKFMRIFLLTIYHLDPGLFLNRLNFVVLL